MNGLQLDNIDQVGSLSQKIFRHHARLQFPRLRPLLEKRLGEAFATEISNHQSGDGKQCQCYSAYLRHYYTSLCCRIYEHNASSAINRPTIMKISNMGIVGDEIGRKPCSTDLHTRSSNSRRLGFTYCG